MKSRSESAQAIFSGHYFPTIQMGVVRKWHFATLGGAANLGGVSGDLFEHCGSGIAFWELLPKIVNFMHYLTGV